MIAKPLNLIIVYILTIINFIILLAPFVGVIVAATYVSDQIIANQVAKINIPLILNSLIFIISFLMIFYLFLDFLFGFSVKSSLKNCKNYKREKDYKFLDPIFKQVQERFGRKDVKLYVQQSGEINAFAVGCMSKKVIVLTTALITHTSQNAKDKKEFLMMLRSIMGHEMSHLVNKDYLPALLIIINQKVTNLVSRVLELIIKIPLTILGYLRVRSRILFDIAMLIYSTINRMVIFFNNKIIFNLYEFIRKFISRSIEYRCDLQSAHAFGGNNMAKALSLFGSNGYFTLFSTHPNTNIRIKKTANVRHQNKIIRPLISSSISNYFAFLILIIICLQSAKASNIDIIIREYLINNPDSLNKYIEFIMNKAANLINVIKIIL